MMLEDASCGEGGPACLLDSGQEDPARRGQAPRQMLLLLPFAELIGQIDRAAIGNSSASPTGAVSGTLSSHKLHVGKV